MLTDNYYFYCASCRRIVDPTWYVGLRTYANRALDAPYFMCGRCRVIGIRASYVREVVTAWRRSLYSRKHVPTCRALYQRVMSDLRTIVTNYCATAGYRRIRPVIPHCPPEAS